MEVRLLSEIEITQREPPLSWAGVSVATRRGHIADLAHFREFVSGLPASVQGLPLDVLLTKWLESERVAKKWHWSTVSRHAGGLIGAFAALSVGYT